MENSNEFITITNKDIYDEMRAFHVKNDEQHQLIIARLDKTNGKVKLTYWIASTALAVGLIAIGYLIQHISVTIN
jgi:hypothetical protein